MAKVPGQPGRNKNPLLLIGAVILVAVFVLLVVVAAVICIFLYTLGSIDDPFRPQAPSYKYTVYVTGLDGFTSGTAQP